MAADTSAPLESSFELERLKRTIGSIDDIELLRHLAVKMAEQMHAQKHVVNKLVKTGHRQAFGFEA